MPTGTGQGFVSEKFSSVLRKSAGDGLSLGCVHLFISEAAPDITISIYWQRVLRSWERDQQTSFAAMPAEVNSFSELNVAEAAANAELTFLWPSKKDRFNSALGGAPRSCWPARKRGKA
jgi:hypothetical protein